MLAHRRACAGPQGQDAGIHAAFPQNPRARRVRDEAKAQLCQIDVPRVFAKGHAHAIAAIGHGNGSVCQQALLHGKEHAVRQRVRIAFFRQICRVQPPHGHARHGARARAARKVLFDERIRGPVFLHAVDIAGFIARRAHVIEHVFQNAIQAARGTQRGIEAFQIGGRAGKARARIDVALGKQLDTAVFAPVRLQARQFDDIAQARAPIVAHMPIGRADGAQKRLRAAREGARERDGIRPVYAPAGQARAKAQLNRGIDGVKPRAASLGQADEGFRLRLEPGRAVTVGRARESQAAQLRAREAFPANLFHAGQVLFAGAAHAIGAVGQAVIVVQHDSPSARARHLLYPVREKRGISFIHGAKRILAGFARQAHDARKIHGIFRAAAGNQRPAVPERAHPYAHFQPGLLEKGDVLPQGRQLRALFRLGRHAAAHAQKHAPRARAPQFL